MTVDAEGCVWSARWEGSCVVRYSPDGEEIGRIALPTPRVTSAIFGGRDYADMYITTAGGEDKGAERPVGWRTVQSQARRRRSAGIPVEDRIVKTARANFCIGSQGLDTLKSAAL